MDLILVLFGEYKANMFDYLQPPHSSEQKPLISQLRITNENTDTIIDSLSGDGRTSIDEVADRVKLETEVEFADEYSREREIIGKNRDISRALEMNANIKGFCNLPESVVKLEILEEHKGNLFRKPYRIAESLIARADEIISRWWNTGKIVKAPFGTRYNNPITIAAKRDDVTGQMSGIRICLDVRSLNMALAS